MAKRGAPSKPSLRPHVRKDGETSYYVRLTFRGRRHEFVIGQTPDMDDDAADRKLEMIKHELALGQWRPPGHRLDADQTPTVFEVFQDALPAGADEPRTLTQSQAIRVNHIAKHLLPYFGPATTRHLADGNPDFSSLRHLDEITEVLVKDYVHHKRVERRAIREMHERFHEGGADGDPALAVTCPVCLKEDGEHCVQVHRRRQHGKAKSRAESHDERLKAAREHWVASLSPRERWLLNHYGASSRGVIDREIKKHLGTLRGILEDAMRAHPGTLMFNPVRNPLPKDWIYAPNERRRPWYRPDHVDFILRAASELDEQSRFKIGRRAAHAAFIFAGLRNGELAQCDWGWIDWQRRIIRLLEHLEGDEVPTAKTQQARRTVFIVDALYLPLYDWWVESGQPARGLVWPAHRTGAMRDRGNVRNRLWAPTIERAITLLEEHNAKAAPGHLLPRFDAGLEPRSGRRSFATLCYMAGHTPKWVMSQIGHADAALALEVYSQWERDQLRDPRARPWMAHPEDGMDHKHDQTIGESAWVKLPPHAYGRERAARSAA